MKLFQLEDAAGRLRLAAIPYIWKGLSMKKIGFITTNKVLAQSLAVALKNNSHLNMKPFLMLNPNQAILDADLTKVDIAVIDVINATNEETETALFVCKKLRQILPYCRLLLLMSQSNKVGRRMAINAVRSKVADDFVFYDTSLEYLFAKLEAF